ncbi:aldo/keto reductase [Paraburkholderia sp. HD33-4]|uniref:aldo/keto reductase n=1 Tax=Paraburkholderia sp. HD33-4 TaxID=2883242 RepID=UPI001F398E74|nr:aldo/keto reductase [Paraburkholderia sp. HD33-4]
MNLKPTTVPQITLSNGMTIPQLGFGTLAVQPNRDASTANAEITASVVAKALEAGYRHIDTAQSYGTERGVGQAIAASGISRDDLYVTSKLANGNHAPDAVYRSFEQTLKNLGVEQLDLFLIHWPLPTLYSGDYVTTWKAVAELVSDGRLRSAGVSNFLSAHLERIIGETGLVPVVNQFELHPYFANRATCETCLQHGIAIEAHSPLGHNREPLSDPIITNIASGRGKSTAQIILRWHIQRGDIVIPKSVRPERMCENMDIFDFELGKEEMAAIDTLDRGDTGRVGPHPGTYEG